MTKSRTLMYVQQTKHLLPRFGGIDNLIKHVEKTFSGAEWALILHNRDMQEDGVTPAEDHIHIAFSFSNPRSPSAVAKDMKDPASQKTGNVEGNTVEIFKGGSAKASMFSYLVHRTPRAQEEGKYQYDFSEVTANFDFKGLVDRASLSAKAKSLDIADVRAKIIRGEIILKDFFQDGPLGSAEESALFYTTHKTKIETAIDARYKIQMKTKGGSELEIIYIQGPSGSGKTTLAKEYAMRKYGDYFISGSSNDTTQDYMGEPVAIFDDARPSDFNASDWLKLLDPFNNKSTITSRYYNKYLAVKCIILTTTTDFKEFFLYAKAKGAVSEPVDQFVRRFNLVINVDSAIDKRGRSWAVGELFEVKKVRPYKIRLGEDATTVQLSHDIVKMPHVIKELIPESENGAKAQDFASYFSHDATNQVSMDDELELEIEEDEIERDEPVKAKDIDSSKLSRFA